MVRIIDPHAPTRQARDRQTRRLLSEIRDGSPPDAKVSREAWERSPGFQRFLKMESERAARAAHIAAETLRRAQQENPIRPRPRPKRKARKKRAT